MGSTRLFGRLYPRGDETGWYAASALLTVFGLLVPSRGYRVAALLITAFWGYLTFESLERGRGYRERMRERQERLHTVKTAKAIPAP